MGKKLAKEDADEHLLGMGTQAKQHKVEGQPVEGAAEVAAEGVLVKRAEAGQVREGGPAPVREEHVEEFREEVLLALANGGVVNEAHLYEDEAEHGLNEGLCEHRSRGRVGGTTELRPIAFACNLGC